MTAHPDRVLLVGMMGVGKSTIGRLLAARLGWPYVDNDDLLRRSTGRTARELLATGGESALRHGEAAALALALREPPPVVLGVAAGVVLDPVTRGWLGAGGTVVWLRAAPGTLVRRLATTGHTSGTDHRPGFADPDRPAAWYERESSRRAPLYASVAGSIVDVDHADGSDRRPGEVVDEIVERLRSGPPG